jgi:hypothetical protein
MRGQQSADALHVYHAHPSHGISLQVSTTYPHLHKHVERADNQLQEVYRRMQRLDILTMDTTLFSKCILVVLQTKPNNNLVHIVKCDSL